MNIDMHTVLRIWILSGALWLPGLLEPLAAQQAVKDPYKSFISVTGYWTDREKGYLYDVTDSTFQFVRKKEHLALADTQKALVVSVPLAKITQVGVRKRGLGVVGGVVGFAVGAGLSYLILTNSGDNSGKSFSKAMSDMSLLVVATQLLTVGTTAGGVLLGNQKYKLKYVRKGAPEFPAEVRDQFRALSYKARLNAAPAD